MFPSWKRKDVRDGELNISCHDSTLRDKETLSQMLLQIRHEVALALDANNRWTLRLSNLCRPEVDDRLVFNLMFNNSRLAASSYVSSIKILTWDLGNRDDQPIWDVSFDRQLSDLLAPLISSRLPNLRWLQITFGQLFGHDHG
jgi:hypothetical protein